MTKPERTKILEDAKTRIQFALDCKRETCPECDESILEVSAELKRLATQAATTQETK